MAELASLISDSKHIFSFFFHIIDLITSHPKVFVFSLRASIFRESPSIQITLGPLLAINIAISIIIYKNRVCCCLTCWYLVL